MNYGASSRSEEPDPIELRTGIQLQEIRLTVEDRFLPRKFVKASVDLADATIISMPNGTVFPLNYSQTFALERLWGISDSLALPNIESQSEGERKLAAHFRRERSTALRDKKLAEVLALHGKYVCELCTVDEYSKYPSNLGKRIFEVHHLSPLSRAAEPVRTTLDDLALLCASCHRAVHATAAVEDNYAALASYLRGEN